MGTIKIGDKKAFLLEPDKFQPVIYSLEEREIGVWTDGKPLYQKTIKVTSPSSSSAFQNMDLSSLNIDTCVSIDGYAVRNSSGTKLVYFLSSQEDTSYYCFARYKKSDGNLNYKTNFSSSTVDEVIFNIQYTKTTDTVGSGTWTPQGVPAHHYSTDEHVVGTWNGETLYEKTYFNVSITNQANNLVESNFDSHIVLQNFNISTKGMANTLFNYSSSVNDTLFIENGDLKYYVSKTGSWWNALDKVDITVQYTKSS